MVKHHGSERQKKCIDVLSAQCSNIGRLFVLDKRALCAPTPLAYGWLRDGLLLSVVNVLLHPRLFVCEVRQWAGEFLPTAAHWAVGRLDHGNRQLVGPRPVDSEQERHTIHNEHRFGAARAPQVKTPAVGPRAPTISKNSGTSMS